MASWRSLQ